MTGIWKGEAGGFKFYLDLIQVVGHDHVNGVLRIGGFEKAANVVGVNAYPEVALSGAFLDEGAAFNGVFEGPNAISGTLRGQDSFQISFARDPDNPFEL